MPQMKRYYQSASQVSSHWAVFAHSVRFVCAVGIGRHYEIKCELLLFGSSCIIKPCDGSVPTQGMIMQDENVVPVQAYSQQQAAEIMALRASKWQRFLDGGWESDFLDDIPISFTVHSKHDWQFKEDNTYDLVIDAPKRF